MARTNTQQTPEPPERSAGSQAANEEAGDAPGSGKQPRLYSMQWRLLAAVMAVLVLLWAVVSAATYVHVKHEVGQLLDAHLVQTANLLAAQPVDEIEENELEGHHGSHKRDRSKSGHKVEKPNPVPVVFQVWKHGELVAKSPQAPAQNLHNPERDDEGFSLTVLGRERWRVYSTAGRDDDVEIIVAENIAARKAIVLASVTSLQRSLLLAAPLVALIIWWGLRRALQPLREASAHIRTRPAHAHDPLPLQRVPREVQPLVEALNQLFVRVGEMLHNERRFTADAAHELRTPIAAIRMMAQVAQGSSHAAEREQALQGVLQGCDRATRLVEQLLQLSRLEADAGAASAAGATQAAGAVSVANGPGAAAPAAAPCDLMPALQQVMDDMRHTLALPRQQHLQCEAPAQLWSKLTPALAAVLLRNLIDNALRYSPPGASVRVRLEQAADRRMRWQVEDSGPGMSDADMAHLGQRFFRVLGTGVSGSGLGWSIVQRIARLYALQVKVDRSPELGGLRVTVSG